MTRLVVEPKFGEVSGGYFNVGSGAAITPMAPGGDIGMQHKLWVVTHQLMKERGLLD